MRYRVITYSSGHPAVDVLVPADAANPLLFGARLGIAVDVVPQATADIVQRGRPEEIHGMEELSVLQQMAVSVPKSRDHEAGAGGQAGVVPGKDSREDPVLYGEALGRGLFRIVSANALITVRLGSSRHISNQRLLELDNGESDHASDDRGEAESPPR